jgi:oligopeptide/dipeptide ABC transporter ATP-binding protein
MTAPSPLLEVSGLRVAFATEEGRVQAVDDVSLEVGEREILAVVGESGSGKSVTALTVMGLTRGSNSRIEGSVRFAGEELLEASDERIRRIRGTGISMVFQDPMSALNPVYRVGDQIAEQIRAHEKVSEAEAINRAVDLMSRVGIPRARERVRAYPHEFSGGMRQRVVIAMALSCNPRLIIADEPTTALDVTIQAQILRQLEQLRDETGTAIIMVTHDLGVVADIADRVVVMYGGRVVEEGTLDEIFYDPQHPYAWGLLGSIARVDRERPKRLPAIPGQPPSLLDPPQGCHFRPRCPHSFEKCTEVPGLEARVERAPGHRDRCWLSVEEKRERRQVAGQIGLVAEGSVIA